MSEGQTKRDLEKNSRKERLDWSLVSKADVTKEFGKGLRNMTREIDKSISQLGKGLSLSFYSPVALV